jgi:hypothetical protein
MVNICKRDQWPCLRCLASRIALHPECVPTAAARVDRGRKLQMGIFAIRTGRNIKGKNLRRSCKGQSIAKLPSLTQ